jgi:hypothetical protein
VLRRAESGFRGDVAHADRLEPATADDAPQSLGDPAALLLVIDLLRHPSPAPVDP